MPDTEDPDVSAAARAMIAQRWGRSRTVRLRTELAARPDLQPEDLAVLRAALYGDTDEETPR